MSFIALRRGPIEEEVAMVQPGQRGELEFVVTHTIIVKDSELPWFRGHLRRGVHVHDGEARRRRTAARGADD